MASLLMPVNKRKLSPWHVAPGIFRPGSRDRPGGRICSESDEDKSLSVPELARTARRTSYVAFDQL